MEIAEILKVNEPNVVHETIDGETILLDLNTGNYFSLDGPGAIIWEYIALCGQWKNVISLFSAENPGKNDEFEKSITTFIEELVTENLLVENTAAPSPCETIAIEKELRATASNFTPPKLNKYSDMQDLLLLDPIHEVDEKGWPESKAPGENE